MGMKEKFTFSDGDSFFAEKSELNQVLQNNQRLLDNYCDLLNSSDDAEFVARGNGFCDTKFSESFLEGQISKYRKRISEILSWIKK